MSKLMYSIEPDKDLRGDSTKWANWMSILMPNSCKLCVKQHGKIVDVSIINNKIYVEAHRYCNCIYVPMRTILVGTATDLGVDGADMYLAYWGELPDYYITKAYAEDNKWSNILGNLNEVLPGKMIGGGIYKNIDGKLPHKSGRIWYEADINYHGGYRNEQRILYSNDGLIFVSRDHYKTFYEIVV